MPLPILHSEPGPILMFLLKMQGSQSAQMRIDAEATIYAVRDLLRTKEGAILMDLLEKSVQLSQIPVLADDRALAARNAQSFIVSDLRRIATNEMELQRQAAEASAGRTRRRPG